MDLYFAPLACSLASRITLYEAGLAAEFHEVGLAAKLLKTGGDYRAVNPKGQVPALRLENGTILTESPAILQYIADLAPDAKLAPPAGTVDRVKLQIWLSYIGSEIHKGIFYLLFNPAVPAEAKAFAKSQLPPKYDHLNQHLDGRTWLQDDFSVADAYLVVTLGWANAIGMDLTPWPNLASYRDRALQRPAVAKAFAEEIALRAAA
jgi:glutathione S-transferase